MLGCPSTERGVPPLVWAPRGAARRQDCLRQGLWCHLALPPSHPTLAHTCTELWASKMLGPRAVVTRPGCQSKGCLLWKFAEGAIQMRFQWL